MRTILMRYGEIGVKGHNRHQFEKKLNDDVRRRLPFAKVTGSQGRYFVDVEDEHFHEAIEVLQRVPGIFSISPATRVASDLVSIKEGVLSAVRAAVASADGYAASNHAVGFADCKDGKDGGDGGEAVFGKSRRNPKTTFKIEVRRANKQFPMTSPEIAAAIGGYVLSHIPNLEVDVHHPKLLIEVEIREESYIFSHRIPCLGGMPYGTSGRAVSLFSGGIDSPVAAYFMVKRGVELVALHFHSKPFTSPLAHKKVEDLALAISRYAHKMKMVSINLLPIQKAIKENCPEEEMTILSRCFMMKIADALAEQEGCAALVTGESIGQVASQTMESINCTSSMTRFPVFRPLIAMDKAEIIEIARRIGTYETSILPYEDCCTIFLPPRVVTKPRLDKINRSLEKLDVERLVSEAIASAEHYLMRADGQIRHLSGS